MSEDGEESSDSLHRGGTNFGTQRRTLCGRLSTTTVPLLDASSDAVSKKTQL